MKREDFKGPPCGCPLCVQAGVDQLESRRDWRTGKWLHGHELKRVVDAERQFWTAARRLIGQKAMP